MNKVILIGNLTADPELRKTASDISFCNFRIAVQRRFANQQGVREADFFNVIAWRQTAELCARFLTKGRKCAVVGSLQNRSYDAQDGTKRTITEVVADEVEFLGGNPGGGSQYNPGDVPPPPEPSSSYTSNNGFTQVDDDELPF
ncbi:MAG: single-stranded DNA-binding protein [Clostridia bacterium]|nr:single-stranded DNA-binding protein [Clostridia bacterium]MBR4444115.1 single-stranded DNA-binding protein [Clostridia bacterium]